MLAREHHAGVEGITGTEFLNDSANLMASGRVPSTIARGACAIDRALVAKS